MNTNSKILKNLISSTALLLILSGCANEAPFSVEGDGVLKMDTEYRGNISVTSRAESIEGYTDEYLNKNLVVYIENSKGVIRKYLGKDQIPEAITLPVGKYVVEGWTGDSISASWDKKFFRGYQDNVTVGAGTNNLSLKLDIANVIATVDKESLTDIDNLSVKFYHSRGDLTFTETKILAGDKAYFMMPNADKDLQYEIEGFNKLGEPFRKTGKIENVKRASLYNLKLTSEQPENTLGGAIIRISIQEIPVIEERFEIFPGPSFKAVYGQDEWNLDRQITSTSQEKDFKELKVRTLVYGELKSLKINFDEKISGMADISGMELTQENAKDLLAAKGIYLDFIENSSEKSSEKDMGNVKALETWITFPESFFNGLEVNENEYTIILSAQDDRDYVNSTTIKIANSESALADPIVSDPEPDKATNPMAILGTSAELTVMILDETAADFGIMYREEGSENFEKVSAKLNGVLVNSRASSNKIFKVVLTGLTPGTTYEYKSYSDDFEEEDVKTFTTEEKYLIPNADMSDWSTDSSGKKDGAIIPGPGTAPTYWDTGNHGSIMRNINLTQSDDTFIEGNTVAKLRSQFVGLGGILGKFAAGNIFTGEFYGVDGTDGILHLGRDYNNSHPSSLNVMVNYRPEKVESRSAKDPKKAGDLDEAQIYVALITGDYFEVKTKNQSKLFDENDPQVLAYGQVTFDDNVGEDNKLTLINIPFKYKEAAKTTLPSKLVIVCAASKFGDYFTGGEGSTMYVDDFELLYDQIQWAE